MQKSFFSLYSKTSTISTLLSAGFPLYTRCRYILQKKPLPPPPLHPLISLLILSKFHVPVQIIYLQSIYSIKYFFYFFTLYSHRLLNYILQWEHFYYVYHILFLFLLKDNIIVIIYFWKVHKDFQPIFEISCRKHIVASCLGLFLIHFTNVWL